MKAGTILREFEARDGRKVILRTPTWEDLDDMLDFINSLVEEEAMILMEVKQTRDQEVDWLARSLSNMEKDRTVRVVAEVDGRMVGQCEVSVGPGRKSHVGTLGISVKQGYRDVGIGQELMREAERHAGKLGVEKIVLEVFATNDRAIHVYERMGYRVVGRVPGEIRYKGDYVDGLNMLKDIY
jgi:ribosomal protein S18 acetylase RimI-like enzyme